MSMLTKNHTPFIRSALTMAMLAAAGTVFADSPTPSSTVDDGVALTAAPMVQADVAAVAVGEAQPSPLATMLASNTASDAVSAPALDGAVALKPNDTTPVVTPDVTAAEATAPVLMPAAAVAMDKAKPTWLGAYLVGQFGQSKVDATDISPTASDESVAVKVGAGYRVNALLAVEANAVHVTRFNLDGLNGDISGGQVSAVFSLPLNYIYGALSEADNGDGLFDRTSLYAKAGGSVLRFKSGSDSKSYTSPTFAIGVETKLCDGYAVRAEFERTTVDVQNFDVDVDVISVGVLKTLR